MSSKQHLTKRPENSIRPRNTPAQAVKSDLYRQRRVEDARRRERERIAKKQMENRE